MVLGALEIEEPEGEVGLNDPEREMSQIQSRYSFDFCLGGKSHSKVYTPPSPIIEIFLFLTICMTPSFIAQILKTFQTFHLCLCFKYYNETLKM